MQIFLRQSACSNDDNSSCCNGKAITYLSPRKATHTHIADLSVSEPRYSIKSDSNTAHIDSFEGSPASQMVKSVMTTIHSAGTPWEVA